MSEFIVARTLKAPHERSGQALTQPSHFGWLASRQAGTAVLDVADRRVLAGDRHLL